MLVLIFAHPYPDRSRANRRLLEAASAVSGVIVRSLYDLYPDFDIDVPVEQATLAEASAMVWQHPLYWYSVPGLLKHWFDKVLARGWAYGEGTHALAGKRCLWVTTTGGDDHAYTPSGMHGHPFEAFAPPIEQTARFCKMHWEEPLILRGAHRVAESALDDAAQDYARRLRALVERADRSRNATP
jgi:glutathione-regulated potassium-efflux system ancillary protein KefF